MSIRFCTIKQPESILSDRHQSTAPDTVRQTPNETPVPGHFLNTLANDIASNPQHLQAVDARLVAHLQALVGDTVIDLDASLSMDDE